MYLRLRPRLAPEHDKKKIPNFAAAYTQLSNRSTHQQSQGFAPLPLCGIDTAAVDAATALRETDEGRRHLAASAPCVFATHQQADNLLDLLVLKDPVQQLL